MKEDYQMKENSQVKEDYQTKEDFQVKDDFQVKEGFHVHHPGSAPYYDDGRTYDLEDTSWKNGGVRRER